jgi:hypothetical protein
MSMRGVGVARSYMKSRFGASSPGPMGTEQTNSARAQCRSTDHLEATSLSLPLDCERVGECRARARFGREGGIAP